MRLLPLYSVYCAALLTAGCANGQLELTKQDCVTLVTTLGTGVCERLGKDITLTTSAAPATIPTVRTSPNSP